jgi:hypothetical protein
VATIGKGRATQHNPDRGRGVSHGGGGDAECDQRGVGDRAGRGAQHRPVCQGQRRVAVGGADAEAGQEESPGQHGCADGDGFGGHDGERDADHARAVFAADRQYGRNGDDRLAEVDPG